jgi:hypothetical protein
MGGAVKVALEKSVGMFAIALWNRKERCLHLVRDRIGEKPLYYGPVEGKFVFASELKAIRRIAPAPPLDRAALLLYLRLAYVPAPFCIYQGLRKVEPGTIVTVRDGGRQVESTRYWSALEVAQRAHARPSVASEAENIETLDRLLRHDPAADGGRCAGRRIFVGRHRQLDSDGHHAGREHLAGPQLFDRLRVKRVRRGPACQAHRTAFGNGSHRARRNVAGRPGSYSAPAHHVGRAVCRFVANPYLPAVSARAPLRDRCAVGRRR